jgi:hypothetical protein
MKMIDGRLADFPSPCIHWQANNSLPTLNHAAPEPRLRVEAVAGFSYALML